MSTKRYSYAIKKDNAIGTMDIYDDELKINTENNHRTVEYNFINRLYLSELNSKDFEIELKNNEIIHIIIIDNPDSFKNDCLPFINSLLKSSKIIVPNSEFNQETINTPTIQENIEIKELYNTSLNITENKNLIISFPSETIVKDNLHQINQINITKYSSVILYEDHIRINNSLYSQKVPYNIIRTSNINNNKKIELILNNNANILLETINMNSNEISQVNEIINRKLMLIENSTYNNEYSYNNQQQYYNGQQSYQQNNNQYDQHYPVNQKSVAVAIILHILLAGLGYAYLDKWGRFIIVLIIITLCVFTSILIIPALIGVAVWIIALLDTISLTQKYNKGELI